MSEFDGFKERLNVVLAKAAFANFLVRDADVQRDALETVESFRETTIALKQKAIQIGDEQRANWLLGWQCVLSAVVHELKMWAALKGGDAGAAWDQLVFAQGALLDALRAHPLLEDQRHHIERLELIERMIFPPQRFMSAGMLVRRAECTICGRSVEDCDHIVGLPYMGEICRRRLLEVEPDHVALVERPANKHCRITHHREAGGRRDQMTWRLEPDETSTIDTPDDQLLVESVILSDDGTDIVTDLYRQPPISFARRSDSTICGADGWSGWDARRGLAYSPTPTR